MNWDDLETFKAKNYRPKNKGKDGRELSDFQRKPWMDKISKLRKYKNQARGEKSGRAKVTAGKVFIIRHPEVMTRKMANYYSRRYGLHPSYVYHIRARKTWRWL